MASTIDSIARGVRDLLNAAPDGTYHNLFANWASEYPAQWRHKPAYKRELLDSVRVVVSSDPEDSHEFSVDIQDRCCDAPWRYRIFIGIAKKAETFDENLEEYSDQDELEALKELAEDIAGYVFQNAVSAKGGQFQVADMSFEPFFDDNSWRDNRIFLSVLSVTYQ